MFFEVARQMLALLILVVALSFSHQKASSKQESDVHPLNCASHAYTALHQSLSASERSAQGLPHLLGLRRKFSSVCARPVAGLLLL